MSASALISSTGPRALPPCGTALPPCWPRAYMLDCPAEKLSVSVHFPCGDVQGLQQLVRERPDNPVEFLAHYLLQHGAAAKAAEPPPAPAEGAVPAS